MNITEITKLAGGKKSGKRLGRGKSSGKGGTSGRGHNGAGSRAGFKIRGLDEGGQMPTFRRIPKRGFNNYQFRTEYSVVNVAALEAKFENGAHVTASSLVESGLVRNLNKPIKVLGNGELTKKFKVDCAKFSKSAVEKITAAGGSANVA